MQEGLKENGFDLGQSNSPVTPVILHGGINEATNIIYDLREKFKIFCSIVIYPVVPKGVIMIRLIPTAVHSPTDVDYTITSFIEIRRKLDAGEYKNADMVVAPKEK